MEPLDRTAVAGLFSTLHQNLPSGFLATTKRDFADLMAEHTKRTQTTMFIVGSSVYHGDQLVAHLHKVKNMTPKKLDPELYPMFYKWWNPVCQFRIDNERIRQGLNSMLMAFKEAVDPQVIRNLFPDHIVKLFFREHGFARLDRTEPEPYVGPPVPSIDAGYAAYQDAKRQLETIWDPRIVAHYGRIGHLIDSYAGYKLL